MSKSKWYAKPVYLLVALALVLSLGIVAAMPLSASAREPVEILQLDIPDTARVVDYDDGIYVVGTSGGSLYVINEAGEYTVTALGAGSINDVRIESPFIAVAAGTTVIELQLSLPDLTPTELWRTTLSDWREVVSTDLSEDGDYVCYLARRTTSYDNAGEVGVLGGGAGGGSLISRLYASGWYICNWWLDATGDMEYIAASQPMSGCCYKVGVALYQFDGSTLTMNWWKHLIPRYETTEVRISEAKDYVAVATSSGTWMKLLSISDGAILWGHETPGKEQFAVAGDDNLNYVIGATQASLPDPGFPPYPWFVLKNLGTSGYEVLAQGTMVGPINDLDSNHDASLLAFGSDAGEFLLLSRSNDTIETVFDASAPGLIDAIEIGDCTLLVGGEGFIKLYGLVIEVEIDIKPRSDPNSINPDSKGVIPVAVLTTNTAVGESVTFDATTVDAETVHFGPDGAQAVHWGLEDVDSDGDIDMVLHFKTQETGIQAGDTEATLTGKTLEEYGAQDITGTDSVRTVPPKGKGK